MLRLFGSVLILGACCSLGLAAQQQLRQRLCALESMLSALDYIAAEITCRRTPLPALIEHLAASPERATTCVFSAVLRELRTEDGCSLPYKWCRAFRASREDAGLGEEETLALCDMAAFLGRYDASQQTKELDYVRGRLCEIRERVREETHIRGRLYRSCGVAIGVMTVLILL